MFNLFQDALGFEKRDIAGQLPRFFNMVDYALPADSWFFCTVPQGSLIFYKT